MLEVSQPLLVLVLFAGTLFGLIRYQSRPDRVFGVIILLLCAFNLVSTEQIISSFANEGLLTLILIMVCSLAVEKTRVLRRLAIYVIRKSYKASWVRLFFLTSISSAFLNNTAVVSTLLAPIRNNPYHSASKFLIPLSYAAILGGTLTLVGTSTNLIVNSMVLEAGLPPLNFFEFIKVGIVLLLGCGTLLAVISRFLPQQELVAKESSDYFIDTKVQPDSPLIGKTIETNGLRNLEALFLVEILRDGRLISPVSPHEVIEQGDRLIFSGDIKKVTLLAQFDGLISFANQNGLPLNNLSEVIIRPESLLVGKTLKKAGFRALFDAAVVAIKRDGEAISGKLGDVVLKPGDYLILAVGKDFRFRHNINKNFYLVSGLETEHLLRGKKEFFTISGFLGALLLAVLELLPLFQGMLLLLGGLLLCGALSPNEILRRLPSQIWLIISAALLLSRALTSSGALSFIDQVIFQYQSLITPFMGLIVIYGFPWLLTELVTNNAAAALMFPIAYGLAQSLHIEPIGYIMTVAFGASASFVSPYGYQTNLMVYNAGQYRLVDFVKVGLPMSLCYGVLAIAGISLYYQLY